MYNENCFESFSGDGANLRPWNLKISHPRFTSRGVLKAVNEKAVKSNHLGGMAKIFASEEKKLGILKADQRRDAKLSAFRKCLN